MTFEVGLVLERFHRALVESLQQDGAGRVSEPFTVAEIYQKLVPYRTQRDRIGVEMNGDYEDALMRLLAGEGGYLTLESQLAADQLREEMGEKSPDTGLYREFAAASVRLNPDRLVDPDQSEIVRGEEGEPTSRGVDGLGGSGEPEPRDPLSLAVEEMKAARGLSKTGADLAEVPDPEVAAVAAEAGDPQVREAAALDDEDRSPDEDELAEEVGSEGSLDAPGDSAVQDDVASEDVPTEDWGGWDATDEAAEDPASEGVPASAVDFSFEEEASEEEESGEDQSGEEESGEDESGEDESGEDESGEDESGEDESGEDESGEDESGEEPEAVDLEFEEEQSPALAPVEGSPDGEGDVRTEGTDSAQLEQEPTLADLVGSEGPGAEVCWSCSTELPIRKEVRFCPYCGEDLTRRPCPECGTAMETGWQFCIICGHDSQG